jgi:5-methylcytosine-specific restriction endonuclease McrA
MNDQMKCSLCHRSIHPQENYYYFNPTTYEWVCYECSVKLLDDFIGSQRYDIPVRQKVKRWNKVLLQPNLYDSDGLKKRKPQLPKSIRERIYARDGYVCRYCGCTDRDKLTIDHIKPHSLGGDHVPANLQVLCRSCNSRKSTRKVLVINNG